MCAAAAGGYLMLTAAKPHTKKKAVTARRIIKPPAALDVTVVDASTSAALANAPIAVGHTYLTTGAGGTATASNLRSGLNNITARASGYNVFQQSLALQAGDNTFTVALTAETGTPDSEQLFYRRKAYLTIDDGPSATWTPEVLNILKKEGVPATFFLIGQRIQEHPELVRRIFLEGHAIGNHTYSHNYDELYRGSARNLLASLDKNGELLETIIGFEPKIMRPPGGIAGNFRRGYRSSLSWAGYTTVIWNVSTGDGSTQTTSRQMAVNAKTYLDRLVPPESAVILAHDNKPAIIKALPAIIAEVRRRGYDFSIITGDLRVPDVIMGPSRRAYK